MAKKAARTKAKKNAPAKAPEASPAVSRTQSKAFEVRDAIELRNALQQRVIDRILGARDRYPEPPMALNGDRLREAAEDYGCLGIALKHLIELMHIEPLVDRALEADPNDDELRGFKKDIACFQILAVIGSISFVPYLQRTAIAHRLDPSPFTICSEHLTAESLAKAIALAEHLALLADISVPAAAGGGDGDGDNGEYRPATYFNKGMADKLRQAASPKRKTKRVRTQVIDGVVCYYVPDARRWWPSGVPR